MRRRPACSKVHPNGSSKGSSTFSSVVYVTTVYMPHCFCHQYLSPSFSNPFVSSLCPMWQWHAAHQRDAIGLASLLVPILTGPMIRTPMLTRGEIRSMIHHQHRSIVILRVRSCTYDEQDAGRRRPRPKSPLHDFLFAQSFYAAENATARYDRDGIQCCSHGTCQISSTAEGDECCLVAVYRTLTCGISTTATEHVFHSWFRFGRRRSTMLPILLPGERQTLSCLQDIRRV